MKSRKFTNLKLNKWLWISFAFLTVLIVALSFIFMSNNAFANESENCTTIDNAKIEWEDWSSSSNPSNPGNYRLTADLVMRDVWDVPFTADNKITRIDLNGHNMYLSEGIILLGYEYLIHVSESCTLEIYDLSANGNGSIRAGGSQYGIVVDGQLNMYSGNITEFHSCSAVKVNKAMNFYGGTISNCSVDQIFGAAIDVESEAELNMYGNARITNCVSATSGGGVGCSYKAIFNMYGGVIENCRANSMGAAVYSYFDATFNFYGGAIINNTCDWGAIAINSANLFIGNWALVKYNTGKYCAGVYNTKFFYKDDCVAKIYGGVISNNMGPGVFNDKSYLTFGGSPLIVNNFLYEFPYLSANLYNNTENYVSVDYWFNPIVPIGFKLVSVEESEEGATISEAKGRLTDGYVEHLPWSGLYDNFVYEGYRYSQCWGSKTEDNPYFGIQEIWLRELMPIYFGFLWLSDDAHIYNGEQQVQNVNALVVNNTFLIEGIDYEVSGNVGTEPGTYTLTCTGMGRYFGTISQTWKIYSQEEIASIKIVEKEPYIEQGCPYLRIAEGKQVLATEIAKNLRASEVEQLLTLPDKHYISYQVKVQNTNIDDNLRAKFEKAYDENYVSGLFTNIEVVGSYFNQDIKLNNFDGKLKFELTIPDELLIKDNTMLREYGVYHLNHENNVEKLYSEYNADNNKLSFDVDELSVFSIAYKDTKIIGPQPVPDPGHNEEANVNAQTGDNVSIYLVSFIIMAALVSAGVFVRKAKF